MTHSRNPSRHAGIGQGAGRRKNPASPIRTSALALLIAALCAQAAPDVRARDGLKTMADTMPESKARRILDILPMPVLRVGAGSSERFFGQAGLAFGKGGEEGRIGLLAAFEPGVSGFGVLTGGTLIYKGDSHMFPVFATLGGAYHRQWASSKPWQAGPMIQLGFLNLGFQGTIWAHPSRGGSASVLLQLYPLIKD